ncbi:hypothetical protein [Photobacterium carnosum]|uniref:hypothetical protein n=1 Tax=Photobacterium carnosum TaxID=2023717 RepID=UPI001E457E47|nr:hypothetical protein [Photobacterium carnosum]MCD9515608.1 hypothetical protein [Photobacterium carnosum]
MNTRKKILFCIIITILSGCNSEGNDDTLIKNKTLIKDITTKVKEKDVITTEVKIKDEITVSDLNKKLSNSLLLETKFTEVGIIKISRDGQFLAVTDKNSDSVKIFKFNNGKWQLFDKLEPNDSHHSLFGNAVTFSQDGKILSIGAFYAPDNGQFGVGKVYIYKFDDDHFQLIQEIKPNFLIANANFGHQVQLSANGETLLIAAPQQKSKTCKKNHCGTVYIYQYDQNQAEWKMVSELDNPTEEASYFGSNLVLSGDGSTVLISNLASNLYWYSLVNKQLPSLIKSLETKNIISMDINHNGNVIAYSDENNNIYLYSKKGNDYQLDQTIKKPITDDVYYKDWRNYSPNGYDFGSKIVLNSQGTVLVATSYNDDFNHFGPSFLVNGKLDNIVSKNNKHECVNQYGGESRIFSGAAYVYLNQEQQWNLTQYLKPPKIKDGYFCTKEYNGPIKLSDDITATISDNNQVFVSTINGQIIEYK